ncbi:MAG: hypothetical protein IJ806_10200 [Ruminococcus sp.]|nr:hypothetical protein [Ruminococcus sp.]
MRKLKLLALMMILLCACALCGCAKVLPLYTFESTDMPANARITMLLKIPEDKYTDDPIATYVLSEGNLYEYKHSELFNFNEDGFAAAECHLKGMKITPREDGSGVEVWYHNGWDKTRRDFAESFGSFKVAVVDADSNILRISNEIPFNAKTKFACLDGLRYSYATGEITPDYSTERLWHGHSIFYWWVLSWLMAAFCCILLLFAVVIDTNANVSVEVMCSVFAVLSLPQLWANAFTLLRFTGYFNLSGRSFTLTSLLGLIMVNLPWAALLIDLIKVSLQKKKGPNFKGEYL